MQDTPSAADYAHAAAQDAQRRQRYIWDELRKYKRRLKKLERRVAELEQNGEDK